MKTDKLLLERIKKDIKKAEVVSFDIFDTLLVRPYIQPTDLFVHMEKAYDRPGFAAERRDAERRTRIRHRELEDITLDMIYDEIDDEFKDMKQKELDWEEMVLRANPELKQVYDYVKAQGKKIVITSDMYLPAEFLAKVLRREGFDGWDKLYVSNERNLCKNSGSIYRCVIRDYNINPELILHIGDNQRADALAAEKCGLRVVLYERVVQQYIFHNRQVADFYNQTMSNFNASAFLGMMAFFWQQKRCNGEKDDYWYELGYNIAGPLALGYMRFVETEAIKNNIDHLLFVARDGYTLQKVFNTFNQTLKNTYVYANGSINRITSLEASNIDHCRHIINFFSDISDEVRNLAETTILVTEGDYKQFIERHKDLLRELSQPFFINYQNYVNGHVKKGERMAVVDSMARTFSSLELLEKFTGSKILGLYWTYAKTQAADKFNFETFSHTIADENTVFAKSNINIFTKNWDIMEFFFSSPEQPIKYIKEDGTPQYEQNSNKYKLRRAKIYPLISQGMVQFAQDFRDFWAGLSVSLDFDLLIKWINCFLSCPSRQDLAQFAKVPFYFGDNDDLVRSIFGQRIGNLSLKDLFYRKEVNGNSKKTKILGLTFRSKQISGGKFISKKLFGLVKKVKTDTSIKRYIAGIKIGSSKAMKVDNSRLWMIIDTVTEKVLRSLTVALLHQKTFGEFRNKHEGQSVVLVGAGPSVSCFSPVKNAVYVGLNRAYLLDKVHFDYLFTIDKGGLDTGSEQFHDGFLNYDCVKFIGDQNLGLSYQIPQHIGNGISSVRRYKTNAGFSRGKFTLDIDSEPLFNSVSTSIQAMQFILFTNPKKVYVVGIDCTNASKQHFVGSAYDNTKRNENAANNDANHIKAWKSLKHFLAIYYPQTEIIVVNPVGLRGIFHDVYTRSYLDKHPEIEIDTVEIFDEKD